ncbi:MAG: TetR/AcrR family transcriptional repressor of nem operon [Cellvibrionaceae bacterium]|jgi:TetR/AcrR family transcriptional repressor of nem operon
MQELNDTAHKILDVAESYTQMHGLNAFSYKDLQREVGIKTSSIHYYFPTKQDLALAMVERYLDKWRDLLKTIAREQAEGAKRLDNLSKHYVAVVNEGKFCMCGMFASDMLSLPEVINSQVREFFRLLEEWIADAIELGQQQGSIKDSVNSKNAASHFLAALEGGMLIARARKRPTHLEAIARESLAQLQQ